MPRCPAIDCPGHMQERKSRFGKTFYSCSTFPECDVIVNDLDQLESKYPDHPRTPYKKKEKKGKFAAKSGTAKKTGKKTSKPKAEKAVKEKSKKTRAQTLSSLSPELEIIVGAKEMARTEVTKKVWDYIKSKNLQDPKNKRLIVPDANLAKLFGTNEPTDMFQMTKLINNHIKKM